MIPSEFVRKWSDSRLRERQGSHEHFLDLCAMLGQPTPAADDPLGDHYCFERGAEKVGGGDGWADVWRKGCFGWEYKGRHKDLNAALRQLQAYALDLQNPPYLVVSDMERIVVHTNWTNTISRRYEFTLADLLEPPKLDILRKVFEGSESLKPTLSPQDLTRTAALRFGELSRRLQGRGHAPRAVAHFLNRLVFCMFAEKANLLPKDIFTRLIRVMERRPDLGNAQLKDLFAKMGGGGLFGADVISWFNGGLFDDAEVLDLETVDLKQIADTAAEHDWSQIDPAIFGALFEEALKATRQRAALGAHYTDRDKILKIVDPVIVRPLAAEWDAALSDIKAHLAARDQAAAERAAVLERGAEALRLYPAKAKAGEAARRREIVAADKARDAALGAAKERLETFLARLGDFRVLDPACGSGNFLYVALHALHDLEMRAVVDAERLGLTAPAQRVGLQCLKGIEIEPYAAELARVTLWIGDLQWRLKNGAGIPSEPILATLDQIECRDALLNPDGAEAEWPKVDAIIGNPPFLGDRKMKPSLGTNYVDDLRQVFQERVPGGADFVCFWFAKALDQLATRTAERAGLVATNSIRSGANRRVLDGIVQGGSIFDAWSNEPWVLEGAAVRVSLVCFTLISQPLSNLDGLPVSKIQPDLTPDSSDVTMIKRLPENRRVAFQGTISYGPFEITGDQARTILTHPTNVNGKANTDVVLRWTNGEDITERPLDYWIIKFGSSASESEAAGYEAPFRIVENNVRPYRREKENPELNLHWWRLWRTRDALFKATTKLSRQIISPRASVYRLFVWRPVSLVPDSAVVSVARDDDTCFGILHCRLHELWSLRRGSFLGVGDDPRYTPTSTFETFPFPEGLTPNIPAADYADDPRAIAIAEAAEELNRLREAWLNPPDLVRIEPEVVAGYPDRVLPVDDEAAKVLKTRTLTNLYNQRPAWLDMAHRRLDAAVAAAYGWPADLTDVEVLARLFTLNQERATRSR